MHSHVFFKRHVIKDFYGDGLCGHFGKDETYFLVKERYKRRNLVLSKGKIYLTYDIMRRSNICEKVLHMANLQGPKSKYKCIYFTAHFECTVGRC